MRWYRKKGRVPHHLRQAACYPASFDAVHGWWVRAAALRHGINVTMVNTPFHIQHHPWLAFHHGAFSNASIVLHELKNRPAMVIAGQVDFSDDGFEAGEGGSGTLR